MKVVYWNNIPAPYMIDRFNCMANNKNYDFEVWFNEQTEDGRDWKVNLKNVKFKYYFIPRVNFYFFKVRLPTFLFTRKPDILISLYSEKIFYIGILLALLLRIKVCVHIVKTYDNWIKRTPIKEFFKKFLLSKINFFETTGLDGESYLKKYSKKKPQVFKHKFNVNVKHFDKTIKNQKKLKFYNNKKEIRFLYVGKIIKEKGLDILIHSVLKLKNNHKEYKNFSLLIVGNGKDKDYYLDLVKKFKINKINFLNFIQKENLPLIFNASDVFIFPSLGDPYGIVIDEAMASKMPVISSHLVGEIKERVINNFNGYIYKGKNINQLTSFILKILRNKKKIKIFGKRSRQLIKNNTPKNYSNQFRNMINKIINSN